MRDRDLWEDHIEGITKQLSISIENIEILEQRINYYESVLATLLLALKKGGVIVSDPDGEHQMPT